MVINLSPLEKVLYTKPYSKPGWSTEWWSAFKISTEDLKVESLLSACMLYTSPAWCSECENLERLSYSFTAQVFDYQRKIGSREWCNASEFLPKILNLISPWFSTCHMSPAWCFRIHSKTILLFYCTMYLVTARWVHDEWDIYVSDTHWAEVHAWVPKACLVSRAYYAIVFSIWMQLQMISVNWFKQLRLTGKFLVHLENEMNFFKETHFSLLMG